MNIAHACVFSGATLIELYSIDGLLNVIAPFIVILLFTITAFLVFRTKTVAMSIKVLLFTVFALVVTNGLYTFFSFPGWCRKAIFATEGESLYRITSFFVELWSLISYSFAGFVLICFILICKIIYQIIKSPSAPLTQIPKPKDKAR